MKKICLILLTLTAAICIYDANAASLGKNRRNGAVRTQTQTETETNGTPVMQHAPAQDEIVASTSASASASASVSASKPVQTVENRKKSDKIILEEPNEMSFTELKPRQLDSLVAIWDTGINQRSFEKFYREFILPDDEIDAKSDEQLDNLYANRLRLLPSGVPLPYNAVVRKSIERYVDRGRTTTGEMLSKAKYYFPMIEDALLKYGLPVELRVVPIIESAMNPIALSRAGASGLWQFMARTGKGYGLEVNSLVDERRDPIASTDAACRYMRDLYNIYEDWFLVLAAYNCGPGNVNKAMARVGGDGKKSFWDIYEYLPAETRGYVPAFIGALYAYSYYDKHNIKVGPSPIPLAVDTVSVNRIMHLEQVSSTIDVPLDVLRSLNPQYKENIIPATIKEYTLVLPREMCTTYIEHEDEIMSKDSLYLKEYINPANIEKKRLEQIERNINNTITYTVKKGDTLSGIAGRNRVTVAQLKKWNNLRSDRLSIGQKLKIIK